SPRRNDESRRLSDPMSGINPSCMSCWLAGCEDEPRLRCCGRHHFIVCSCDHHSCIECPHCGGPLELQEFQAPNLQYLRTSLRELLHTTNLVPSTDYLRGLYPMEDTTQLMRLLQDRNLALSERQRNALQSVARRRHSLDEFLLQEELQNKFNLLGLQE
ncbi:unnamed protein product, partial [Symbiodinium sp. KB8]